MLGKKKKDNKKVEVLEKKELITTEPLGEELVQAPSENLPAVQEKKAVKKKETSAVDKVKDAERSCVEKDVYEKFPDLARLMNTTVENLRDEFFLFQIRKLMSKIGKVVVRHSVTENEL